MTQQHQPQPDRAGSSKVEQAQERADLNTGVLSGATTSEEIALNDSNALPPQRIGSADADSNADLANNGGLGRSDD